MITLILSDMHLGSKHCQAHQLLDVLEHQSFDRLILNGDTLHSLNLRKLRDNHWRLLTQLREIGRERELILIRGNHDHEGLPVPVQQSAAAVLVNGHSSDSEPGYSPTEEPQAGPAFRSMDVLPALLGVEMLEDYQLDVGGKPYLVTHGDHFDPALESELPRNLAGWCYQMTRKVNKKLAKWLKKRSARWSGVLSFIRQEATEYARIHDYAGIVIGHTHYADDMHLEGVHYVNTGCWTESACTFVTVQDGSLELHQVHE